MIFADKVVQLRKKSGWSQEELAEKLNVTRQSVSKWEGAQSIPDLEKILQLAQIFGDALDTGALAVRFGIPLRAVESRAALPATTSVEVN